MKHRARIEILSDVLSFPTIRNKDWTSCYLDSDPRVGDLVALSSAPATKYYLSWVRDLNPNNGWPRYLLESIDDGELCWWENVGLSYYNRERVAQMKSWQWDDEQFEFYDRWKRVCKRNDAYIVLPCQPSFTDKAVWLDVRIRYGWDDYRNPVCFPNWKRVTMKMMDEYYKASLAAYNAKTEQR